MTEQLKPCPFCGSRGMIAATLDDMYRPMCERDGCCALDGEITRTEAIAAWNTRPTPADVQALVEAAKAALRILPVVGVIHGQLAAALAPFRKAPPHAD